MDSLVHKSLSNIYYRDAFEMLFEKERFQSIEDFAKNYFMSQPSWLRLISMNCVSKQNMQNNILKSKFEIGTQIGSWKIFDKDEKEIVFGESMGFMDYRFSMKLQRGASDKIEVSTVVKINTFMGKYYFSVVKLMHTKFVVLSLKKVV